MRPLKKTDVNQLDCVGNCIDKDVLRGAIQGYFNKVRNRIQDEECPYAEEHRPNMKLEGEYQDMALGWGCGYNDAIKDLLKDFDEWLGEITK